MNATLEGRAEPRAGARRICPAVLILLDDAVEDVSPDLVRTMARLHPDALPFLAAVRIAGREGEPRRRRLVRVAFETVTDVVARREALQRGLEVEDVLRVFLVFAAGEPDGAGALPRALQTVHRVAAEFFDQTRLEVHAVGFLPDLDDPAVRELRYRDAYRRLLEVEDAAAGASPLAHRPHASFDYRWIVDSRTRMGAHAGGFEEVSEPVAEFLARLLDGRELGPRRSAEHAAENLRATVRDRHAAYSTFGLAVYFHYPRQVLRALAASAATAYLRGYLGKRRDGPHPLPGQPLPVPEVPAVLAAWSEAMRTALDDVVRGAGGLPAPPDADARTRQTRQRSERLGGLDRWLESALRDVLARGGVPLARRVMAALTRTSPPDDPAEEGVASVGALRREALRHVRDLLHLDAVIAEESRLRTTRDALARDAVSDPARREEAQVQLQRATALRRRLEEVLEAAGDPEALEERFLGVEPELTKFRAPAAAPPNPPGPPPATEPSPRSAPSRRRSGRLGGIFDRILGPPLAPNWLGRRIGRRGGEGLEGEDGSAPPASPPPSPPALPPSAAGSAWPVAERLRAVQGLTALVDRLDAALSRHEGDVAAAARSYDREHDRLRRWLTEGSRFYIPALDADDFAAYADRYVDRIEERLANTWDRRRLAACFHREVRPLAPFDSRLLARIPELPDALTTAAEEVGAPLLEETLVSLLRRRMEERGGTAILRTLHALEDNAQPLSRPMPPGDAPPITAHALYGTGEFLEVLRADGACGAFLDARRMQHVDTHETLNLCLCTSLHGFSAHGLRKLLAMRAQLLDRDGAVPEELRDLVPLDVGATGAGADTFEVVVLARALEILAPVHDLAEDRPFLAFEDVRLPADLLRATEELAFSLDLRGVETRLMHAIDARMARPDGIERLRARLMSPALSNAERNVIIEVVADFEVRSAIVWRLPIVGEEGVV